MAAKRKRRLWTGAELAILHARYADMSTLKLAAMLKRPPHSVYNRAAADGLCKSAAYRASPEACRLRRGDDVGAAYRFTKGHVPANKGLRRPGYARGRMRQTQFKKGGFPVNRDPDYYVIGALRINTDGYIDMRTSFAKGAKGWTGLHRVLWQDARGPIPKGYALVFKDGDQLNVELGNLELITRRELMRRNSVHNLPAPLASTIQLLGQLKRRINERACHAEPH